MTMKVFLFCVTLAELSGYTERSYTSLAECKLIISGRERIDEETGQFLCWIQIMMAKAFTIKLPQQRSFTDISTVVFLAGTWKLLEFAKCATGQICAAKHEIILCEKSL